MSVVMKRFGGTCTVQSTWRYRQKLPKVSFACRNPDFRSELSNFLVETSADSLLIWKTSGEKKLFMRSTKETKDHWI